jgi:hypothetical protein
LGYQRFGATGRATARLVRTTGALTVFEAESRDGVGPVGRGRLERVVVDRAFLGGAAARGADESRRTGHD